MSPLSRVDFVCGDVGGKKRTGTPVVCFARDIRCKECEAARTDVSDVSDDSASVRDAEAYVNTDCHEESETSRALLVESKQPRASVNKPFSFLQWNVNGLLAKLKDNEFISCVSLIFIVLLKHSWKYFSLMSLLIILCSLNQPLSYRNRDVIPVV